MNEPTLNDKEHTFSLVAGGPFFRLMRRAGLCGDDMEFRDARVIAVGILAWAPLLALSALEDRAAGNRIPVPFLLDVNLHVRMLLALPFLILGEGVAHRRLVHTLHLFLERNLIADGDRAQFERAAASAHRFRDSAWAEAILLALVVFVGEGYLWRDRLAIHVSTWYATVEGADSQLTLAGWWYVCLALPLGQFIYFRWYLRILNWTRFLWQVSRINLRLLPMHPDRVGGLGFLSATLYAFVPLLVSQSIVLAGLLANHIFFDGASLPDFKIEIVVFVAASIGLIVAPLYVFAPLLESVRRTGGREYDALAERYMREFDRKWLRGGAAEGEQLVGSADIQSLADIGNSLSVVREMKLAPVSKKIVLELVVLAILPLTPLLLTMVSFAELIDRMLQRAF